MKKLFLVLLLLTQTLVSHAKGHAEIFGILPPIDAIIIKQGSQVFISQYGFTIKFESVIADSRCPIGCHCFLTGWVEVKFVFISNKGDETTFVINTFQDRKSIIINGYKISLMYLTPYPTTGDVIQQKDYEAEIIIKKKKYLLRSLLRPK